MKQHTNIVILVTLAVMAFFFLGFADSAFAQSDYVPLSPLPGITDIDANDPGAYFAGILALLLGVAGVIAVIILMFYGAQYMLSASEGKKAAAKAGMTNVVFGIAIIFLSWVALYVINPDLVSLRFFKTFEEGGGGSTGGTGSGDGTEESITPLSPPKITFFKADDPNLSVGESTFLRWNSTGATECQGTGFSTGGKVKDSVSVSPPTIGEYDYILTCINDEGIVTETARLEVLGVIYEVKNCPAKGPCDVCSPPSGYIQCADGGALIPECAGTEFGKSRCCQYATNADTCNK